MVDAPDDRGSDSPRRRAGEEDDCRRSVPDESRPASDERQPASDESQPGASAPGTRADGAGAGSDRSATGGPRSGSGRRRSVSGSDPRGSRRDGSDAVGVLGRIRSVLRTSVVTGAAVTLPLLVTVLVVVLAASVVSDVISPFVVALSWLPVGTEDTRVLEVATVVSLLVGMTAVGYVAAYWSSPSRLERPVDEFMTTLPAVGQVYETFSKMSEFIVDSDADCFQEVVLVEYPTEDSYAVAFETAEPPEAIEAAVGDEEMLTLFVPMAPNPVMGGFVLHVPPEQVVDVDLSVEQGIQSIVTSGVATGTPIHEQPDGLVEADDD